jgi:N-acetylglucosamine-6-phosphate deacetylase
MMERVRGRIPGRAGLWETLHVDGRVEEISCVDPDFAQDFCLWITPGLFDLQINGISGINFSRPGVSTEELARADRLIREHGVSRYCPTLITASRETTLSALSAFDDAWRAGALGAAWGIHLEGPWISPEDGSRGIHQLRFVREPDPKELAVFQRQSGGRIRILTVAPERPGAEALIRAASRDGITVSLGHTCAEPSDIEMAVRAGARMSTHLFNGCARMMGRHSNVIYSQLAEDSLYACFIADGHHVPFPTLRIGIRAKGATRSILVSDIVHLSGLPEGEHEMEGNRVELRDGGLWVKGSWQLSGAARTLEQDVELLARQAEPGIEQALLMATRNPAAALGDPDWAEIRKGRTGPIAVFSWDGSRLLLQKRIGF